MLSLHYKGLLHGLCTEIINTQTTRHIQHIALKVTVMLGVYRFIIRIRTDQVTCNVFSVSVPSYSPFFSPSAFSKTLLINPQSRATCPAPPLQPHHPRTINPSSTTPSKLTRRRQRKISVPNHSSTNSRTVIPQMPSSAYFTNKFPVSTNLVGPMTN